ncbi:MAG: aldehyde dehydrogenase, partial [Armatimonadetes bacterium]|nr:aldehyde dehydrogenase [Armatimonadota bacterium]
GLSRVMPNSDNVDISFTVSNAKKASQKASSLNFSQRKEILEKAGEKISINKDEIEYLVKFQGIPMKTAEQKIKESAYLFKTLPKLISARYSNNNSNRLFHLYNNDSGFIWKKELDGIVSAFIAGNDIRESAFVFGHIVLTGNTCIMKPSSIESYFPVKFAKLLTECGYPEGALNVINFDTQDKSRHSLAYSIIAESKARILFGGDATLEMLRFETLPDGAQIDHGKKGHFITFGTGGAKTLIDKKVKNLEEIGDKISKSSLDYPIGCLASKVCLIEENVYEYLKKILIEKFSNIKSGDPLSENSDLGYYQDLPKILEIINEAVRFNLIKVINKKVISLNNKWQPAEPFLLEAFDIDSEFLKDEYSMPILTLYKYKDIDEGIRILNKLSHINSEKNLSLAVSIYSERINEIKEKLFQINAYHLNINEPTTLMNFALPHHGYYLTDCLTKEITINWHLKKK